MAERRRAFQLGGTSIPPGARRDVELPVARLPTGTGVTLPIAVLHGRTAGPAVWLSAAIHGDELNGVEIIRQVLGRLAPRRLAGTVVAVPIVNVFGFIHGDRYLPDRRDLNRSFPGSPRGSIAARLAALFMHEVVEHCDYGIDLHTGSDSRANLPQIRADLDDPTTATLAAAFGAPIVIDARVRDGSLRAAAAERGTPVLLYEAGEANRFDDDAIDVGVAGVLRVLAALEVIDDPGVPPAEPPARSSSTHWVRARRGGILSLDTKLGDRVEAGLQIGSIYDALKSKALPVRSSHDGVVIGVSRYPLVHRGEAVAHIAVLDGDGDAVTRSA